MRTGTERPKILIVAMADSIHTARWIDQIADEDWDIHLFSCDHAGIAHNLLRNATVHYSVYGRQSNKNAGMRFNGMPAFNGLLSRIIGKALSVLFPKLRVLQLKRILEGLAPDVIHSLETQKSGYLTADAKIMFTGKFPVWMHSNWGSDLYLFGKMPDHIPKIRKVLENCGHYLCECHRDLVLARQFGFKGKSYPPFPNGGGFDLERLAGFKQKQPSQRRLIMLKGYQGWAGRAMVGLEAIQKCMDILSGYEIYLYSVDSDAVRKKVAMMNRVSGMRVQVIRRGTSHEEIMKLHGKARISIGLSISDAISTSLLEAMVMGSFPIQSWTSCADEWIKDGVSGILVPPEDPAAVEAAIRKAVADDGLVDHAAGINDKIAKASLEKHLLRQKTVSIYEQVLGGKDGPDE